jgi:cellulose synthase/poly-beta-1,6-N-acetylglucosamine synthase-like glycosyltransferase
MIAFILATSFRDQLEKALFDDTFAGIHRLNWFDYTLLIPYFLLLAILCLYGLHRYEIIRAYWKHRKDPPPQPLRRFQPLPRVTIQLPIYNERFVVERLLEEVSKIDYPHELLQVQVLDDSTDDTHPFTERLVAALRTQGFPIEYHHRDNRHGFKAGALEAGLKSATGEFVAVFDADFLIPRDFLHRTLHFFTDEKVGVVQTRWTYLNRHSNLLTEAQAILLDGHFVLEHAARSRSGLWFNFNGTAGMLRRSMIEDAGGWQHDTLTEDSDLSYRAQLKGWKFVYLADVECPSELPVETFGFQMQQSRWAKGLTQVARKLLHRILTSDAPRRVKFEAFCHLTPSITFPLMVVVSALMLPVMICRFYVGWQELLIVDVPILTASFASVFAFYTYAQHQRDRRSWPRTLLLMPVVMAAVAALTVVNTRAVLEALVGIKSSFVRTPKFAITGEQKAAAVPDRAKYRSKSGWIPYLEIAMGSWFLFGTLYCLDSYNFLAVPLLSIFVAGYYWAAFSTIAEEHKNRMAWERGRKLAQVPQSSAPALTDAP